jgi:hypothetical protein
MLKVPSSNFRSIQIASGSAPGKSNIADVSCVISSTVRSGRIVMPP